MLAERLKIFESSHKVQKSGFGGASARVRPQTVDDLSPLRGVFPLVFAASRRSFLLFRHGGSRIAGLRPASTTSAGSCIQSQTHLCQRFQRRFSLRKTMHFRKKRVIEMICRQKTTLFYRVDQLKNGRNVIVHHVVVSRIRRAHVVIFYRQK